MKKQTNFSVVPAILSLTSLLTMSHRDRGQVLPAAATPAMPPAAAGQSSVPIPAPMSRQTVMKRASIFGMAVTLALLALGLYGPSVEAQKAPGEGGGVAGAQFPPVCGQMNNVSSPNVGSSINDLIDVSALANNDVWAVGSYFNGSNVSQTLVEHWDGSVWSVVPSPNTGIGDVLNGVFALASNDVWAVGNYYNSVSANTLMEHWDGTAWSVISSPSPPSTNVWLGGVSALASNDVWAAGSYFNGSVFQTLVEHWDGAVWSVISSPDPGAGTSNYLSGVSALASNDVWAVGNYINGSNNGQTLVEHWNGAAWSVVPSPNVGASTNELSALSALTINDVWAVGYYQNGTVRQALVEHWNGTAWSVIASPNPGAGGSWLFGVAALTNNDAWAVGYQYDGTNDQTLLENWNGSAWNVVTSSNLGATAELIGVAAVSAGDAWAVGYYDNTSSSIDQTLAEQYSSCPTTPTPIHSATPSPTAPSAPSTTPAATTTACPVQFPDVPQGSTFYTFIRCLACRGIINGYPDGSFKPNNNVTRGQLSKIISNAAGFSDAQPTRTFQDVPLGSTFQVFIGRLASRGQIGGYRCGGVGEPCMPPANLPYFRPNNNATRGQIAKIDANAAGFSDTPTGKQFEDVGPGSTYYTYTFRLVSRSIMAGYPCGGAGEPCILPANLPYFRPNNNATRGQTSKIVSNTFFPNCQTAMAVKR